MRGVGQVAKGAVALVMIVAQRLARVDAREDDVEQAVVVEVLDHRRRRRGRCAPSPFSAATSTKRPGSSARREHARIDPVLRRHRARVGSERHVRDVQQPPHLEIVGMLAEYAVRYFAAFCDPDGSVVKPRFAIGTMQLADA